MSINLFMPMAGEGRRVQSSGKKEVFKPFVEVKGKPIFCWALDSIKGISDFEIYSIVTREQNDRYGVGVRLQEYGVKTICLEDKTNGPLETLFQGLQQSQVEGEFFSLDCDLRFQSQALSQFITEERMQWGGSLLYFQASSPSYSYIKTKSGTESVSEIKEKVVISSQAVCGCYYFNSARLFIDNYGEVERKDCGELYLSNMISHLIAKGVSFKALPVENHSSFGTLEELKSYS